MEQLISSAAGGVVVVVSRRGAAIKAIDIARKILNLLRLSVLPRVIFQLM